MVSETTKPEQAQPDVGHRETAQVDLCLLFTSFRSPGESLTKNFGFTNRPPAWAGSSWYAKNFWIRIWSSIGSFRFARNRSMASPWMFTSAFSRSSCWK